MARRVATAITIAEPDAATLDLKLDVAEVRTEVVVTATGPAQSTDEIAKSVDSLRCRGPATERRIFGDRGAALRARACASRRSAGRARSRAS